MNFTTGLFKTVLFASALLIATSLQAEQPSKHSKSTNTGRPVNPNFQSNSNLFTVVKEELERVKKAEGTEKTQAIMGFWSLMADIAPKTNGAQFMAQVKSALGRFQKDFPTEVDLINGIQQAFIEIVSDIGKAKKTQAAVLNAAEFVLNPSEDRHNIRKEAEDILIERINKKTAKNIDASRLYLKLLAQYHKGVSESKEGSADEKKKASARYAEIMKVVSPTSEEEETPDSTTKGDDEKKKEDEKVSEKKDEPKEKRVDPEKVKQFEEATSTDRYQDWRNAYEEMEKDVNKDVSADERKYVEMSFTNSRGEKGDYEVFKDKNGDVKGQGGLYAVPKSFTYKDANGKERTGVQAYRALLADKSLSQAQRNEYLKKNLFKVVGGSVVGNAEYNAQGKLMFRGSYPNNQGRVSTILYGKDAKGNYGINHVYQPRQISSSLVKAKAKTKNGVFDSTLKLIGEGEDKAADGAKKILSEATKTKTLLEGPTVVDPKVRAKLANHKIIKIGDQEVLVKEEEGRTKMLLGFEEGKEGLEPVYYCIDCEQEVRGIAVANGHKFDDKTGKMILPKETKVAKISYADLRPRSQAYANGQGGAGGLGPVEKVYVQFGQFKIPFSAKTDPKTGQKFILDYDAQGKLGWIPLTQGYRVSAKAAQEVRTKLQQWQLLQQQRAQAQRGQFNQFNRPNQFGGNQFNQFNQFNPQAAQFGGNQFNQFNNNTPVNRRINNSNQGFMPRAQRVYRNIYDP